MHVSRRVQWTANAIAIAVKLIVVSGATPRMPVLACGHSSMTAARGLGHQFAAADRAV
jgi:hypothetical protein